MMCGRKKLTSIAVGSQKQPLGHPRGLRQGGLGTVRGQRQSPRLGSDILCCLFVVQRHAEMSYIDDVCCVLSIQRLSTILQFSSHLWILVICGFFADNDQQSCRSSCEDRVNIILGTSRNLQLPLSQLNQLQTVTAVSSSLSTCRRTLFCLVPFLVS